MEIIKQTSKEYFRALTIVHIALILGPVFFGVMIAILSFQNITFYVQDDFYKILLFVVSAFYAIGIIANPYIFRGKLASINKNQDLGYKISIYRSALITRYALIEGPAYFALVATLLTNQFIFLGYAGFSILMLMYFKPTKDDLITDLELSSDEIDIINNPIAVITEVTNTSR